MFSGSEAGSYLRLIDFVYHSTLGLRVIKQKKKVRRVGHMRDILLATEQSCSKTLLKPDYCTMSEKFHGGFEATSGVVRGVTQKLWHALISFQRLVF